MNICFVNASYNGAKTLPPIIISLASLLNNLGYKTEVYPAGETIPGCTYLVIQSDIASYGEAVTIARKSRALHNVIIGQYVTHEPASAMTPNCFDYGIVGDPDLALVELVSGKRIKSIAGLVYRCNGAIVVNQGRRLWGKEYAPCDFSLWKGKLTEPAHIWRVREHYSDYHIWDRGGRSRKVCALFKREVSSLVSAGIKTAVVMDRNLSCGEKKIERTIEALDLFDGWSCFVTVKSVLESEFYKHIKSSRCTLLYLHFVSASNRLLGDLGLWTLENIELAVEMLSYSCINIVLIATVGLPFETVDSLKTTQNWLRSIGLDARIETFIPVPGTMPYNDPVSFDGFRVCGTNYADFIVDDSAGMYHVPWESAFITARDFILLRNEMVAEFNTKKR